MPTWIGKKIKAEKSLFNYRNDHLINVDGVDKLLVPLQYQNKNTAILLLDKEYGQFEKQLLLIKQFAELTLLHYFEHNKPPLDATDYFISRLTALASSEDFDFHTLEAKVLGYDFSIRRIALVVRLKGFWERCILCNDQPTFEREETIRNWKRRIESAINGFFTKNSDVITAYLGEDKFVVFKAVLPEDEEKFHQHLRRSFNSIFGTLKNTKISRVTVGFGNAADSVRGLTEIYRQANFALELGEKLWQESNIYYFGDLGLLAILTDTDKKSKVEFANHLLGDLAEEDLLKTLEVFLEENLNLSKAAEQLGIHRNTAIYRLNQISGILGLDPRSFDKAVTIKIALIIKKYFEE